MIRRRNAFTLVELLVVASLMAVLFSLIITGGKPKPSALRAAQDFASMLLATQSRALGKPQGAAIIIEAENGAPRMGTVLHEGDTPPPITIPAIELGVHLDFPDLVTLKNYPVGAADGDSSVLRDCYKFRYQRMSGDSREPVSPWLGLRAVRLGGPKGYKSPAPNDAVGLPIRRDSAGQSGYNTFFAPSDTFVDPIGSSLANYEAVVVRHPTIGLNSTTLPPTLAIDLRHSGVGDDPAAAHGYGSFEGAAPGGMSPLAIVFDQTGRVSEVIQKVESREVLALNHNVDASDVVSPPNPPPNSREHLDKNYPSIEHPEWRDPQATDPIVPNEIIYFLFIDRDAITNNQSLASDSAAWVAIDPHTGRISVSSNQADSGGDLAAARAKARAAAAFGK